MGDNSTNSYNNATAVLEASVPSSLDAFAVSFGINVAVAVGLLLIFCVLRLKFKFFYPRPSRYPELTIPKLPNTLFTWIYRLVRISDDEVLRASGLDALVLVRAYWFGLRLFLCFIYSYLVILPINCTAENGLRSFDQLTMANIPQHSPRLWAHFVGVYLFSAVALVMLNKEYREFVSLRLYYNQLKAPHTYSIMVKGIPPKEANETDLKKLYDFMQTNSVHGAVTHKEVQRLDEQYAKRQDYCNRLEHCLYVYDHDPQHRRPTHKSGLLGLVGPRVDSIDFYRRKLAKYNELVKQGQSTPHPSSGNGFVTFDSLASAAISKQTLAGSHTEQYIAMPAPEPCDVYWPNLSISENVKLIRRTIVGLATFFLCFFYMIPVAFVQTLTSMESLSEHFPGFKAISESSAGIRGFLEGFLPTLALKLFFAILPMICEFLAIFAGNEAYSLIEASQLAKMFYFQVFNIFLGSLLTGSILQQITNIIEDPTSVASLLGQALPSKATFFTNYVMLLSTGLSLGLLRVFPMLLQYVNVKFFAKTPKEVKEARTAARTRFGVLIPELLLVLCVGMTYSVIAPLCLAFCVLYMAYAYTVRKYLVLYVDDNIYQSGGNFFAQIYERTIAALMIMQVTMIGLLGLKVSPLAIPLIPAPILTFIGAISMTKWYGKPSKYIPLLMARSLDESTATMTGDGSREVIDPRAYMKPCLKDPPAVPARWDQNDVLIPPDESDLEQVMSEKPPMGVLRTDTTDSIINDGEDGRESKDEERSAPGNTKQHLLNHRK